MADQEIRATKRNSSNSKLFGVKVTNFDPNKALKTMMNTALPNPDSILKKLRKDVDEYQRMKTDSHVSSCIQSRKSGVLSLQNEVQKGQSDPEVYEFVKAVFEQLDIHKIMNEMLEFSLFGMQVMELYYKRSIDSKGQHRIVISDIVAKSQKRFVYDTKNLLRIKDPRGGLGEICENNKFIVLRNGTNLFENPYGEPILSKCYWNVHWKQNAFDMYFNYLDKYGIPIMALREIDMPIGAQKIKAETAVQILDDIMQGSSVFVPRGYELQKYEGSGTLNTDLFKNLILMCNAEISKAILSQTLTTEQGDTGSYAMSQTHLQVRKDVVDSDKLAIENAMNRAIELLVDINFGEKVIKPKFILFSAQDVDSELAVVAQNFLNTGKVIYKKKFFVKNFGWEEDEFELVDPAPAFADEQNAQDIAKPITPTTPKSGKKKTVSNSTIQDMLDTAIATALGGDGKAFNSAVATIKNFLESKGSYENAISSIMDLFDDIDYGGAAKKIEQIQFIADCVGHLSITQHLD